MQHPSYPRFSQSLVIILLAILTIGVLIFAKGFLVPIVLALIFSMFLLPLAERFERWGAHRKVATLLSLVLFLIVAIGIISGLSLLIRSFIADLPTLGSKFAENTTAITQLAHRVGIENISIAHIRQNLLGILQSSSGMIANVISSTTATVTQASLVIVYTFFMLSYRNKLKAFMYRLAPASKQTSSYREIIHNMMNVIPQYLIGLFSSAAILALFNSVAFTIIGIEQGIFLGVLVALLNIIPYIGPIVGFLSVIVFAFFAYSPLHALGVAGAFLVVEFIDNNILTPSVTASRIKLNGLTAIMGIILGGMIWGIVGMILALPVLAMIKIILQGTPGLEPFAYLMGTDDTDEEQTILHNEKLMQLMKKGSKDS